MTTDTIAAGAVAPSSPFTRAGARVWTGRVLSALAVLFLAFDAVGKLTLPPQVVEGTQSLGYPASVLVPLGILQVVCLVVYLIPRTSILGAVLWGAPRLAKT